MSCKMPNLEECEKVAIEISKKASEIIRNTSGKVSSIESKATFADLVTETDKNVEKLVFEELRKSFPSHKFIGEESTAIDGPVRLTDEPTWIIDPVDGTMNFVHTFPFVAVCIGLCVNKQPVLGVVNCPMLDRLYTARKGNGAYCNGIKLQVRPSNSLRESLVCAEIGSDRDLEKKQCVFENMQAIGWQCHGLRCLGSAALNICSVASGHANAFYEFGLHCWDMCAPSAVLLEAGGHISDTNGQPLDLMKRRIIAACSEKIARELSSALVNQLELPSD